MTAKKDDKTTSPTADLGQDEVQENFDQAEDQGFIGVKTDPKPNEVYSMEGGAPGPEARNDVPPDNGPKPESKPSK